MVSYAGFVDGSLLSLLLYMSVSHESHKHESQLALVEAVADGYSNTQHKNLLFKFPGCLVSVLTSVCPFVDTQLAGRWAGRADQDVVLRIQHRNHIQSVECPDSLGSRFIPTPLRHSKPLVRVP